MMVLTQAPPVTAGGLPIGGNVQVTDAGLDDDGVNSTDMVAVGNTVYAAWEDRRDDDSSDVFHAIYFAKSTDGGATWGTNKRVSNLNYDAWTDEPSIAVQPNGTIWIVWWQYYRDGSNKVNDVRLAKSTDGGNTFQLSIVFDGDDGYGDTRYPVVAADQSTGKVYVLVHEYWTRGSEEGFEYTVITFDANGQKEHTKLVNDVPVPGRGDADFTRNSRMAVTAGHGLACAAWEDKRNRFAIYGSCSSDGGATWSANFQISGSDTELPSIAIAPDGSLYAAYRSTSDARKRVLLRRSADKGATWGEVVDPTRALNSSDEGTRYDLAVDDNGQVLLAFIVKRGSRSDVYLGTSLDNGVTFANILLQDGQGKYATVATQYYVSVAVSGTGTQTRGFVVWYDDRNSHTQVWSQALFIDGIPPTAPGNLQASADDRSILLTWSNSTDSNGVLGYRIYRSATGGGPYDLLSPLIIGGNSFRDVELDATPYFYRVVAVDNTNNIGPASNEATATALQPSTPSHSGTLAYNTGSDVHLRDLPNGTLRTVATGYRPRFSKDGARLFYAAQKSVWVKPITGGNPQAIFYNDNGTSDYDIADNESRIAMVLQRTGLGPIGTGICFLWEPTYFDRNQQVYVGSNEISNDVALSPDNAWLAHNYQGFCNPIGIGTVTPGDLCIVNLATGKSKCVDAHYRSPDFAPSGGWLAFSANLTGQYEIWKAQLQSDGTLAGLTQLTRGPANQPSDEPNWSSDSNWVVFKRDVDPSAGVNWQLHVVRGDGASVRNLGWAGESPAWLGGGNAPPNVNVVPRVYLAVIQR
jgi:hypothetical protein